MWVKVRLFSFCGFFDDCFCVSVVRVSMAWRAPQERLLAQVQRSHCNTNIDSQNPDFQPPRSQNIAKAGILGRGARSETLVAWFDFQKSSVCSRWSRCWVDWKCCFAYVYVICVGCGGWWRGRKRRSLANRKRMVVVRVSTHTTVQGCTSALAFSSCVSCLQWVFSCTICTEIRWLQNSSRGWLSP